MALFGISKQEQEKEDFVRKQYEEHLAGIAKREAEYSELSIKRHEGYQAEYARQSAELEAQIEAQKRQQEIYDQMQEISARALAKDMENSERFSAILDKWEEQAQRQGETS